MTCLSPAEHQVIKDAGIARERFGRQGAQRIVVTDCTAFGIRHLNPETGELPASIENQPRAVWPTRIFANDDSLISTMDTHPYPCWAARPNNACIHANPALTGFTGHPVEDFLKDGGTGWIVVIHAGDHERTKRIFRDGFQTLLPFQTFYRLKKADGLWGWAEDWAYPFYRPSGHLAGYIGFPYVRGYERDPATLHASIISL